ncbi:chaperonin GroES [Strigomonas culicis]|uniref:Chaperonin GroES n=2 Tax=Strigomonas culicis TaxID=28005 RepID=S9UGP8_9TRYP|nr:chaperonin GroES [Strigomonas culicis]|eukprot:EPY27929.1 chaperonin GroES [Strigomonas culicis]
MAHSCVGPLCFVFVWNEQSHHFFFRFCPPCDKRWVTLYFTVCAPSLLLPLLHFFSTLSSRVFHSLLPTPPLPYPMFRFTAPVLKKLQPLGNRVLVKRTQAAKQTKAGILIPEQVAGKINEGKVVAVAAANKDWTPTVKANDTVLLPEYGGAAVKVEGEEFFLYEESMLLGVLTE